MQPARARKKPKKITPEYLHRAALYYLERYAASAGRVRRVLMDKVRRSCREYPDQDGAQCAAWVEAELETLTRVQLVQDDMLLQQFLEGYRARGMPSRLIAQKLQAKQFDSAMIEAALAEGDREDQTAQELDAARRYIKRRRFDGLLQTDDRVMRQKARAKIWAALARQGYGPETIEEVFKEIQ